MSRSKSPGKTHSPSSSSSQLTNILELIPLETWLQILRSMDLKTLVFMSSTCAFFRQLYVDDRLDVFYHSHRKPIHISKALTASTEPGEPQSPQTNVSASSDRRILFPKVLMVELPWIIPQNVSFDQVSFITIRVSEETNSYSNPGQLTENLFEVLNRDFPMLKYVVMSKITFNGELRASLAKFNHEFLYLQNCHLDRFDPALGDEVPGALVETHFKKLGKVCITARQNDHVIAMLPSSLREFTFHGYAVGKELDRDHFYCINGSACEMLKSM